MKKKLLTKERSLGNKGESIARKFLEKKGLKFIDKNYHSRWGEVDLVMFDKKRDEHVFVEVKTRTSNAFGDGAEAITKSKVNKIRKTAGSFFFKKLKMNDVPFFRIDAVIVCVDGKDFFCEHIEEVGFDDFN